MANSVMLRSCCREPGKLGFEQPPDFLVAQPLGAQLLDRAAHDRLREPYGIRAFLAFRCGGDERARTVPKLDDALVLELAIGFRDRVRVDHELLGQRPDAGQLLARPHCSSLDGVLHLLHQLEVDRDAEGWVRAENHVCCCASNCITELAQCYCDTTQRDLSSSMDFRRSSKARLTRHDTGRFPGQTLFDRIGRATCSAGCLPRKELYEAWEMARRTRRLFRGGRIVDLGGGHGLLAQAMLLLDDTSPSAVVVDTALPPSASKLHRALCDEWPRL